MTLKNTNRFLKEIAHLFKSYNGPCYLILSDITEMAWINVNCHLGTLCVECNTKLIATYHAGT